MGKGKQSTAGGRVVRIVGTHEQLSRASIFQNDRVNISTLLTDERDSIAEAISKKPTEEEKVKCLVKKINDIIDNKVGKYEEDFYPAYVRFILGFINP